MIETTTARPRAPIRRLSPETVSQIAAGEVVERPASVVKELVENSIDANAREVRVRIEEGGLARIEVVDDGDGIPPEELALALERHATSKLVDGSDLHAIRTLGFRGEALAAIGSVSRLRIFSRTADREAATGISADGGRPGPTFSAGRAIGTTVELRDLFYNTPARRKFAKSAAAEQLEVAATVERLYLSRPDVGLTLSNENGELGRYPPTTRLRDAAARVFGPEFVVQSVPFRAELSPEVRIEGVVGRPTVSRSTRQSMHIALNGRPVHARSLQQAIRSAFTDYLPRSRFPVAVVQIQLAFSRVDVNVHPTKREVRIARGPELEDALRHAIRTALREAPHAAEPGALRTPLRSLALQKGSGVYGASAKVPPTAPEAVRPPAGTAARWSRTERLFPLEPHPVAGTERHPRLDLLGSALELYWVASSDDGIVLVDQHAASERVLYNELRARGRLARQRLVIPWTTALGSRQATTLEARAEELENAGYQITPFGRGMYRVMTVPSYRGRLARANEVPALLDELADGGRSTVPDGLVERVSASIACHAAVRGGDRISREEMARILETLFGSPAPNYACPHGRPIVVRLPRARVDRWFLRSGSDGTAPSEVSDER